jgi:hypothetical protein
MGRAFSMTPGPAASSTNKKPAAARPRPDQQRAPSVRRRQRKSTQPPLFTRRHWLRAVALSLGILVLLAHVFTLKPIAEWLGWLHIDWPDIAKHCAMLSLFTLTYRLSWVDASRTGFNPSSASQAGLASILVCSSWGALCETLQHWIPARDFSVWELSVNILTPLLITGLIQLASYAMLALRRTS